MRKFYSPELKKKVVRRYKNGDSIKTLSAECEIPISTIRYWINNIKYSEDKNSTMLDYKNLLDKVDRIERENIMLKAVIVILTA